MRALVIPSFMHEYDKDLLRKVHEISVLRSLIKEANLKGKYILAVGPSSINLIAKTLGL